MPDFQTSGFIKAIGGNLIGDAAVLGTDPGGVGLLRVGGLSALNGNVAVGAAAVVNSQGWARILQAVGASAALSLLDPNAPAQQWDIVLTSKNLEVIDVQTAGHAISITKATLAAVFGGAITATTSIKATTTVGIGTDPSTAVALNVANAALAGTVQVGAQIRPTFTNATTVTGRTVDLQLKTAAASFTMPTGAALFINTPSLGAGSTVTEVNGIYIDVQSGGTTNYAIQTAGGRIRFVGLPTSASGLAAGTLWSNSGVLTVA